MPKTELDIIQDVAGWQIDIQSMYNTMNSATDQDEIVIPINSYGGSVLDGTAYYNIIKQSKAQTTTKILGYAISMGTVIALAGDKVTMPTNGYFMIHNPWTVAYGESKDLEQSAALLKTMTSQLVATYVDKTGMPESEIRDMMDAETWLTGAEALEKGFVDELYDVDEIEASFDASMYSNVPQALAKLDVKADKTVLQAILSKVDGLSASVKEFFSSENDITNHIEELEAQRDLARNQLAAKVTEYETLEGQITELQAQADKVVGKEATITELNAEVARLKASKGAEHTTGDEQMMGGDESEMKYDAITLAAIADYKRRNGQS